MIPPRSVLSQAETAVHPFIAKHGTLARSLWLCLNMILSSTRLKGCKPTLDELNRMLDVGNWPWLPGGRRMDWAQ
jgi:hypothetical protein